MGIRIYLTGRIAVESDEELAIDERQFRGKQGRLVFAYLVSEGNRSVPREELARLIPVSSHRRGSCLSAR